MRTLKDRGYIILENKAIKATEKGILTSDKLQEYFSDIINETYTSTIEESLDVIAHGDAEPKPLLKEFWERFEPLIESAMELMEEMPVEKAGIECPECGNDLLYRYGKYGKNIACSGFPKYRYIHQTDPKFGPCPGAALVKLFWNLISDVNVLRRVLIIQIVITLIHIKKKRPNKKKIIAKITDCIELIY